MDTRRDEEGRDAARSAQTLRGRLVIEAGVETTRVNRARQESERLRQLQTRLGLDPGAATVALYLTSLADAGETGRSIRRRARQSRPCGTTRGQIPVVAAPGHRSRFSAASIARRNWARCGHGWIRYSANCSRWSSGPCANRPRSSAWRLPRSRSPTRPRSRRPPSPICAG